MDWHLHVQTWSLQESNCSRDLVGFGRIRKWFARLHIKAMQLGIYLQSLERWNPAVRNNRRFAKLFVLIMVSIGSQAMAQSTIFNIPTTDTVAKKKVYAEFDFLMQAPATEISRTYLYNPRLVIGAPGNFEFGVNFPVYNTRASGASATNGYIQPNAKWKFYSNDNTGIALAVGGLINTPLSNRDIQDSWGLVYGLISKKIKTGNYGPRFHAGPYGVISANQDSNSGPVSFLGPRAGAILGYEQPVHKRISIVADWYSGKNGLGYFTPGVSISVPGNGLLNAGYSIGNDSWEDDNATRNRYLFFYYGVTF
jgi:hypothetical protein